MLAEEEVEAEEQKTGGSASSVPQSRAERLLGASRAAKLASKKDATSAAKPSAEDAPQGRSSTKGDGAGSGAGAGARALPSPTSVDDDADSSSEEDEEPVAAKAWADGDGSTFNADVDYRASRSQTTVPYLSAPLLDFDQLALALNLRQESSS